MILLRRRNRIGGRFIPNLTSMKASAADIAYLKLQRLSQEKITNSHAVPAGRDGWDCSSFPTPPKITHYF